MIILPKITATRWVCTIALMAGVAMSGCAWIPAKQGVYQPGDKKLGDKKQTDKFVPDNNLKPGEFFTTELKTTARGFVDAQQVAAADAKLSNDYHLGPGDRFSFLVRGREDISQQEIIVSPDGLVALPRVGLLNVNGQTLKQITDESVAALKVYYENPDVTIVMREYRNNKVYVLGRVATPGAVNLQGQGTLLEALSLCGGMPADVNKTFLSRCVVLRGRNIALWIDLKELLERGNMNLNVRLQNGDVIFIPMSEDSNAYVMGEVKTPGVIPLRTQINLMAALMSAGGPTKDANLRDVFLIHQAQGKGIVERINLQELVGRGNGTKNYVLRDGDIIYVPETGLSKFNYFTQQLSPFFTIFGVTLNAVTGLGIWQSLYYGNTTGH
jgi:polysaccharide export outer membrane protein